METITTPANPAVYHMIGRGIRELESDLEANIYVQKGSEVKYDRYGRQKNLKFRPNHHIRDLARLALRNIYNEDTDKEKRIEAGKALGYSEWRIKLHEKLRSK